MVEAVGLMTSWMLSAVNTPAWCRVSQRGRWHYVTTLTEDEALETICGRVYALAQAATVAVGDRPGDLCEKCHAASNRFGSPTPPIV